jgi:hypothetical protein
MFLDVDGTIVVLTPTPTLTLLVNTGAVLPYCLLIWTGACI